MNNKNIEKCLYCLQSMFIDVFDYKTPPVGETRFDFLGLDGYRRKIIACEFCGHFYSTHQMNLKAFYQGEYNQSTYRDVDGMRKTFERIINLDFSKSDNQGRCNRIESFIRYRNSESNPNAYKILDVGSGLGVFPYEMSKRGYAITALDPDAQAIEHIQRHLKISTLCANFLEIASEEQYDMITFNKVLEHVEDPIAMLSKAKNYLKRDGIIYIELPDGEMAKREGSGREEFFVDHMHVFSFGSIALMALRCNLDALQIERIKEPSTKFTLRAFMALGN